ncbi:MAG: PadR family transcriptional regulator [Bryobacteraceae bacterium]
MQGTVDLMILRTPVSGPSHGHAIAKRIQRASEDVLQVETLSFYPALHRLEAQVWNTAEWELSDKGKRAKFYSLTRTGRKHLTAELPK